MVETCGDIGTKALKKLGVLRAGGEMKAADAADMLASLTSQYMEWVAGGTFGRVYNTPVSSASTITATPNQHVNILVDGAVTVELPMTVDWCYWQNWRPCRDYGWGLSVPFGGDDGRNVPRDKAVVMVTDQYKTTRATYVYDGTVQRWMRIDGLTLTDEAPLSARGPDGLASVVAMRMADEYGIQPGPSIITAANRYKLALVSNHGNADDGGCC